jgi:hypothetical protein
LRAIHLGELLLNDLADVLYCGVLPLQRQELTQLRRENARLREERDILKKATAWFAQEEAARARKTRSDS